MWTHPKYKQKLFTGKYDRLNGERVFSLVCGPKTITFESWQSAKKLGWVRQ